MSLEILKIVGLWRGADGKEAEVDIDLGGADWYRPDWTSVDMLIEPRTRYQTAVILENGTRVLLPTNETPRILPDKTGVLVIFENDSKISKRFSYFSESDNAAVFNADGSLRFFLKNPCGEQGRFRAIVNATAKDNSPALGVLACPKDWPVCEWIYIVDGSTDDLSKQVPSWIRE